MVARAGLQRGPLGAAPPRVAASRSCGRAPRARTGNVALGSARPPTSLPSSTQRKELAAWSGRAVSAHRALLPRRTACTEPTTPHSMHSQPRRTACTHATTHAHNKAGCGGSHYNNSAHHIITRDWRCFWNSFATAHTHKHTHTLTHTQHAPHCPRHCRHARVDIIVSRPTTCTVCRPQHRAQHRHRLSSRRLVDHARATAQHSAVAADTAPRTGGATPWRHFFSHTDTLRGSQRGSEGQELEPQARVTRTHTARALDLTRWVKFFFVER